MGEAPDPIIAAKRKAKGYRTRQRASALGVVFLQAWSVSFSPSWS